MKRIIALCALVLVCVFASSLAVAPAFAGPSGNSDCLVCHDAAGIATSKVDFSAPAVDFARCNACHWVDRHSFDIFHQQAPRPDYMNLQCNTCHGTDFPARPQIIGYPNVLTASGYFQDLSSLAATPGALHAIHVNGSWPKLAKGHINGCGSCHGNVACSACHTPPASPHADHTKTAPKTVSLSLNIGKKYGDSTPDTYLYSRNPTTSYGSSVAMFVGNTGSGEERIVIRLPLDKIAGASVVTATLQLTRSTTSMNFPVRAYRLRRTDWSETSATWNVFKPGSNWGSPGANDAATDYLAAPYAESANGQFDVTALVKAALADGNASLDLLVRDPVPVSRRYAGYYTQQTAIADWMPLLTVDATATASIYSYPPVTYTVCSGTAVDDGGNYQYQSSSTCVNAACHNLLSAGSDGFLPTCASCHPDRVASHGYEPANHTGNPSPASITISGITYGPYACSDCHSTELGPEHARASSSSHATGCATCHPAPRSTLTPSWDRTTCAQDGCHTATSTAPMHAAVDAGHQVLAGNAACFASGCHQSLSGKSLAEIHSAATTTVAGVARTGCGVCHAAGVPATKDCLGCHPERATAHGYDPAKHMSSETCLLSCHATELKPLHDAATSSSVACTMCHPTAVDPIKPWNGTCAACHSTITHSSADHTGTDATVRLDRGGNGCSDTPPGQTGCHDISNVSALHFGLPGKGCAICHGAGKTPTRDCRVCHPKNDPITSESFVATYYPTADGALVGTAVSSSGTTRWDKVDEPNPGDGDTTYFQFTSPGSAMFTAPHSLPSSATITSVIVYARARTGSSTTRAYYPMVTVGGTAYSRAATNIGASYTTGSGVAYSLTTNPKTGAAWRLAELTSTGGASTLDSFGVGTSNASSASTGYLRVTQCYLVVNYTLPVDPPAGVLLGGSWYHHNNVKYLNDPSDAPAGMSYYPDNNPSHGWYDALYANDCYDSCHTSYSPGFPDFSAYQGSKMWYSVGGDYASSPQTRTLELTTLTVPATSPTLQFMTSYKLTDVDWGGTDHGYVEVSTNHGASWTALTGTVGGTSRSTIAGNSSGWVAASYDLAAYAGQTISLRFRYVNDPNSGAAGWGIDNVTVSGGGTTAFSDDAETAKTGWTNYHWTRAKGAWPFL